MRFLVPLTLEEIIRTDIFQTLPQLDYGPEAEREVTEAIALVVSGLLERERRASARLMEMYGPALFTGAGLLPGDKPVDVSRSLDAVIKGVQSVGAAAVLEQVKERGMILVDDDLEHEWTEEGQLVARAAVAPVAADDVKRSPDDNLRRMRREAGRKGAMRRWQKQERPDGQAAAGGSSISSTKPKGPAAPVPKRTPHK